jgi:RNA polymerase sigma factor (sigma-70 family)
MAPDDLKSISALHTKYKGKQLEEAMKEHYKMVCSLAKKYSVLGFSQQELISEGILGLMFALERFDETQNVKFSTYAFYWIRGQILRFVNKFKKNQYHDLPPVMAAGEEGVFYDSKYHISSPIKSIDEETEYNFVNYEDKTNHEYVKEINSKVRVAIDLLPLRERRIISQRWVNQSKKTLAELAEEIGISPERIRQIEKKALENLKEIIKDNFGNLDAYLSIGHFFLIWASKMGKS